MTRRIAIVGCTAILACALCAGETRAETHVVLIDRMAFRPATLRAHVGDVIEWRNEDAVPHTATASQAGFDVMLAPGATGRSDVEVEGRFDVLCRFHPDMRMRLEARRADDASADQP